MRLVYVSICLRMKQFNVINLARLECTDKRTQIRGTLVYRPFRCSLRRIVVADIALPMAAAIIDVKRVLLCSLDNRAVNFLHFLALFYD